jgi:hypothetical protein
MISRATILCLVSLLATVLQRADASCASHVPSHDQSCIELKTSALRSAYLQRAGIVRYDESNRTPQGLRQQLQQHFDAVLSLLSFATSDSIDIAVGRLEAADDHSWTAKERTAWRQKLLAARRVQLQRLAAYRDRGIFPLNEGQSAHAAPIFVDRHGTACAVGHLMRCSGWTEAVESIEKSNNLVYVPDATQGAIAAWVLTSGLTFEEAALIQPGYDWWGAQFDASAYEPGELELEKDGLRFSNFRLQAQNYIVPPNIPTDTGPKPTMCRARIGDRVEGSHTDPNATFLRHIPIGTNWFAIGVDEFSNGASPLERVGSRRSCQMVVVQFRCGGDHPQINGSTASPKAATRVGGGFQGPNLAPPPEAILLFEDKRTRRSDQPCIAKHRSNDGRRPADPFKPSGSPTPNHSLRSSRSVWKAGFGCKTALQ